MLTIHADISRWCNKINAEYTLRSTYVSNDPITGGDGAIYYILSFITIDNYIVYSIVNNIFDYITSII